MAFLHQRHMFSFSEGHEHLSEQFLDIEDPERVDFRLLEEPDDTEANRGVEIADEC